MHAYVSTACEHRLHGSCQKTCKLCNSSCGCSCHPDGGPLPMALVDQARRIAARLLLTLGDDLQVRDPELAKMIETNEDLFWIR